MSHQPGTFRTLSLDQTCEAAIEGVDQRRLPDVWMPDHTKHQPTADNFLRLMVAAGGPRAAAAGGHFPDGPDSLPDSIRFRNAPQRRPSLSIPLWTSSYFGLKPSAPRPPLLAQTLNP